MSKKLNFRFLLLLVTGIFLSLNVVAQTITVKGHVQDTDGHPVVFASVTSVNPKALTNTDAAGKTLPLRLSRAASFACLILAISRPML